MVAVSRFVEFSVVAETFAVAPFASGDATAQGTRGFSRATALAAGTDSFTITLNDNDQLKVNINNSGGEDITLASGTDLDPRFVARDITTKLNNAVLAATDDAWKFAQCEWRNGGPNTGNNVRSSFVIYSGKVGDGGGVNDVNVTDPSAAGREALITLGWSGLTEGAGEDWNGSGGSYVGAVTISGAYSGQFNDHYTVTIGDSEIVADPTGGGVYVTNGGVATSDGHYAGVAAAETYTVTVDTSNGTDMGNGGAGAGAVSPIINVTSTPTGDSSGPTELLYPNHYYDIGTLGVRMKFTDAPFDNGDIFTVVATAPTTGGGAVGTAEYTWTSSQGDSSKSTGIGALTTAAAGVATQLGKKGVNIVFGAGGSLSVEERFDIICRGPLVLTSAVSQLNFGNVTVSTDSPVKVVWFELISGANSMSTVKFSLQADGTFSHHDTGDADTNFKYGTVGAGNEAPGAGSPTGNDLAEFPVDSDSLGRIVAGDLINATPTYLNDSLLDLPVVSSADLAKSVGNFQGAVVSDFIYLAIQLGANETGSNSTINYRMYFDFS
jgi:hypothetical protein